MATTAAQRHSALCTHLKELEADIKVRIAPNLASSTTRPHVSLLRVSAFGGDSSHTMAIVQVRSAPRRRVLVKGAPRHARVWQSLEAEVRILTEIAPKISARNPRTRCPEVIAYYPDRRLVLLEMVEGVQLYTLLFGLRPRTARHSIPALLHLCAEWLSAFHEIGRTDREGNPFIHLRELLERPSSRVLFDRYASPTVYGQLLDLLERCQKRYLGYTQPLTTVHGEFAPYHVLVQDESIYVIDLASTRTGYAFEDTSLFAAFYDVALPWRRAAASVRMDLDIQKQLFMSRYLASKPATAEPERALMRLARIHAAMRLLGHLEARDTWKRALYSSIARPWMARRFRQVCSEEMGALQADIAKDGGFHA